MLRLFQGIKKLPSLESLLGVFPFGGQRLSPEVRPIVVLLPERLYPKAFLGLAPSVLNTSFSLSHDNHPLICCYIMNNINLAFYKQGVNTLKIKKYL